MSFGKGFALVREGEEIMVNTVAETERATKVNALAMLYGYMPHNGVTDEEINAHFERLRQPHDRVAAIAVIL